MGRIHCSTTIVSGILLYCILEVKILFVVISGVF